MSGKDIVPIKQLKEAASLSEEILADIELNRTTLTDASLKVSRLARLLNDFDSSTLFVYEAGGYPSTPNGVSPEVWRIAQMAGRVYEEKDPKTGEIREFAYLQSINELEVRIATAREGIVVAKDRDVSLSSANPRQFLGIQPSNLAERSTLRNDAIESAKKLAKSRSYMYAYVSRRYYELMFSDVAYDIFHSSREFVENKIADIVPDALKMTGVIKDYLATDNPERFSSILSG